MKHNNMRSLVITLISLGSAFAVSAQTNTTVQAKLHDLQEGTMIYLSPISSSTKKDSMISGKGEFKFNLKIDEGDIYLLRIGKSVNDPGSVALIYLQPGSFSITAKGPLLTDPEFSGSSYAKEFNDLNRFIKNAPSLSRANAVAKELNEAYKNKDSVKSCSTET